MYLIFVINVYNSCSIINLLAVSCVVNYAYDASEPDELTIRPGDVLRDVERLPGGWWRGELHGRRGMFPDNFVSLLAEHANSR